MMLIAPFAEDFAVFWSRPGINRACGLATGQHVELGGVRGRQITSPVVSLVAHHKSYGIISTRSEFGEINTLSYVTFKPRILRSARFLPQTA